MTNSKTVIEPNSIFLDNNRRCYFIHSFDIFSGNFALQHNRVRNSFMMDSTSYSVSSWKVFRGRRIFWWDLYHQLFDEEPRIEYVSPCFFCMQRRAYTAYTFIYDRYFLLVYDHRMVQFLPNLEIEMRIFFNELQREVCFPIFPNHNQVAFRSGKKTRAVQEEYTIKVTVSLNNQNWRSFVGSNTTCAC